MRHGSVSAMANSMLNQSFQRTVNKLRILLSAEFVCWATQSIGRAARSRI